MSVDVVQYARKMGSTVELNLFDGLIVGVKDTLCFAALWLEDVSVQGKAMRELTSNPASKSVDWEHLIVVIILKDVAD